MILWKILFENFSAKNIISIIFFYVMKNDWKTINYFRLCDNEKRH